MAVAPPDAPAAVCEVGLPPAGRPLGAASALLPAAGAPCPALAAASGRCWDVDLERLLLLVPLLLLLLPSVAAVPSLASWPCANAQLQRQQETVTSGVLVKHR